MTCTSAGNHDFMNRYRQFQARPTVFRGVFATGPWRLKVYSISLGDLETTPSRFEGALTLVERALPAPDPIAGRPGVGFMILHAGRGFDYVVVCWWDRENELPMRLAVREQLDGANWRLPFASESVCVWDLQLIAAERDAYVATVLSGRDLVTAIEDYVSTVAPMAAYC